MVEVRGDVLIERPVEAVFDFVADERNRYDPRLIRAELISEGPIGVGSRFRSVTKSMGRTSEMLVDIVHYDRPRRLETRTMMPSITIDSTLTFEPVAKGTQMLWEWTLDPRGALRLLAPILPAIARRQAQTIWTGLKETLQRRT